MTQRIAAVFPGGFTGEEDLLLGRGGTQPQKEYVEEEASDSERMREHLSSQKAEI